MTRLMLLVAFILASARADDDLPEFDGHMSHFDSDVCQACFGDSAFATSTTSNSRLSPVLPPYRAVLLLAAVVFPNNGSHTSIFKSCFATVDEVCASDRAESHSFCRAILREPDPEDYPREPGDEHGMMHVVEVCGRAALRYV